MTTVQTLPRPAEAGRYAGMRLGVIKRNSTAQQVDNWSSVEQEETALAHIAREGGEAVIYDEQGTSGRDLNKRAEARRLLDDIRAGELQGLFAYDIKRLTRDVYGGDAATIARRLIEHRALLITHNRDYRLWRNDEMFSFRIEAALAGRDVMEIRDTVFRGIYARAKHEPFFVNGAPFGYKSRLVEAPARKPGQATSIKKVPMKDPERAEDMAALVGHFDTCASLGEVVAKLYKEGRLPNARHGRLKGKPRPWSVKRLRAMLENPLYYGVWEFGRTVDKANTVWDPQRHNLESFRHYVDGKTPCPCGNSHDDIGDLSYWTKAQAANWLKRLTPQEGQRERRFRTYSRPLLGVLACVNCGETMISAGGIGYACPHAAVNRRAVKAAGACSHPQAIGEKGAVATLHGLLPQALKEWAGYRGELRRQAVARDEAAELRSRKTLLEEKLAVMYQEWYGGATGVVSVPKPVREQMTAIQVEIDALESELEAAGDKASADAAAAAFVNALTADATPEELTEMPLDQFAAMCRLVLANVRIQATGWAGGRKFEVVSYTNLLTNSVNGTSPSGKTR